MKFQWPGGVGVLSAVGPLVDAWRSARASACAPRCGPPRARAPSAPTTSRAAAPAPLVDDLGGRHHPRPHVAEGGSIGGRGGPSRLRHGISPRAVAARPAPRWLPRLLPAVRIPSARGARDEHGRDRVAEREPGGDVARGRRPGQERRLAAARRAFARDLLDVAGNSSFSSSAVTPESTASSDG